MIKLKIYFRKKKWRRPRINETLAVPLKKVYPLGNSCLVCGFSFIQMLVDRDGNTAINKYLDKKLRLSVERLKIVKDVCNITNDVIFTKDTGVCQKCFRNIEMVLKIEKEAATLRDSFKSSVQVTMQRFVNSLYNISLIMDIILSLFKTAI